MIQNYLKIALRNLLRNKVFSAINIFGLAISMSICLIVIMMVADQMSYDSHISQRDRVFRINTERLHSDDMVNKFATTALPMAEELKDNYSGIEAVTRLRRGFGNPWINFDNDINIPISGFFADNEFFDVFEYELLYGDKKTALSEPNSVVLTKKAAEKLFQIENPLGEVIKVGDLGEYKITGVLKAKDYKSHIKFEALGSLTTLKSLEADSLLTPAIEVWDVTTAGWVYARLESGTSVEEVENYLKQIDEAQYSANEEVDYRFYLQNVAKITPGPLLGNQIGPGLPDIFVYFLGGLALIIMITACFNYTNLSIAKALTRAKEVGIRKVSGATKFQVFFQFISEAIIISLLAFLLALAMLAVLKPAFHNMNFTQLLQWDLSTEPGVILFCFGFSVFVGLLAGLLPASLLSSFQPVKVLKKLSNVKLLSRIGLRKTLVVIQFTFSLIFIISTMLVYNQLDMMVNSDYGFNGKDIINVKINDTNAELLKNELLNHSSISNVSASSHLPAAGTSYGSEVRVKTEDEPQDFNYFMVDEHYIENLELELIAGANFSNADVRKTPDKIIINESMLQSLGYLTPIEALNETLIIDDSTKVSVIGVVKDYNHEALMVEIGPMALIPNLSSFNMLQVKYTTGNRAQTIDHIEKSWSEINPSKKVSYQDFSEEVSKFYDLMFGDLVDIIGLITLLTITIACLGLLGMATFTAESKVKEISIRKVLGATDQNIVLHLSKGFFILLLIAIVIALPTAHFINNLWLESLAYRVNIDFTVIALSTGVMLLLGALVIGSQAIKATFFNPIERLRNE
ncbi:FtsX-like permease family protein [Fulvivirga sp. RKSG066]|uniref:ABC transporter permease n=1 Tax=Fulvivirga aurantia TaxID=2529383 RepID=UPI0012BD5A12|nr:ABC transporter permease [Fulvivirga aurantia]MTI20383.1 FtsX-like permease family protein [Fulvivirga aurantia]